MSTIVQPRPGSLMEASFNAQMIAFAPFVFQTALSLRNLGVLQALADAGRKGMPVNEIAEKVNISDYGVQVLLELGCKIGLVELRENEHFVLLPTGRFILDDAMTRVNMDFTQDVCYEGLFHLEEAVKTGTPAGLKVFGEWNTVYEALSSLPDQVQKSWFAFDHYYSDAAFPLVLPLVFAMHPTRILDVGGNTGKWSVQCCGYDPDVRMTILDLPGQLEKARVNLEAAGCADRVELIPMNLLDHTHAFPTGFDAVWMSQFLVCFSEEDVVELLKRGASALAEGGSLFILDTFCDCQQNEVGAFCLEASSLYFTCMANGNSRMYTLKTMKRLLQAAGLEVAEQQDNIAGAHTLLRCSCG